MILDSIDDEIDYEPSGLENIPGIISKFSYKNEDDNCIETDNVLDTVIDEESRKHFEMAAKREYERKLNNRQKQIDYGKNTNGYKRYRRMVAKHKRTRNDPKTPNKHQICSKRSWDGQVKKWRRHLHIYDPNPTSPAHSKAIEGKGSDSDK